MSMEVGKLMNTRKICIDDYVRLLDKNRVYLNYKHRVNMDSHPSVGRVAFIDGCKIYVRLINNIIVYGYDYDIKFLSKEEIMLYKFEYSI